LILKFLIDSGAPMDMLLRSPGNNSLLTVVPVDEQYLIDYFQLDIEAPLNFASNRTSRTLDSAAEQINDTTSQIQSLLQNQTVSPPVTGNP